MKTYRNRIIDAKIQTALKSMGAVLIEGPKWSGKTTTGIHHSKSVLKMQNPNSREQNILAAQLAPETLLVGDKPRLIDEWQTAPILWDAVRSDVDDTGLRGQYILTGSSSPVIGSTMHTGTGRIARLKLYPMSLYESGHSTGSISLNDLFLVDEITPSLSNLTIDDYADLVSKGGWPQLLDLGMEESLFSLRQYVKSIYNNDIQQIDDLKTDPFRLELFMKSYSRNIHTLAKNSTLVDDMITNDVTVSKRTIYNYLTKLQRLFIVEEIPAWSPNIRSRTAIRTSNKRSLIDPSIAVAVLALSPKALMADFKTFGFLFENLCIRDLKIYADAMDGNVLHYNDAYGLECDAIVRLADGRYGLVEVKLSDKMVDSAAENLLKLKDLLKDEKIKPSFMMILTGSGYAYTRPDGIHIVPLGCLKD